MKGAGFGRLVVDGVEVDDPYLDGLDDRVTFEVLSDSGPRYRIDRVREGMWPLWSVRQTDPASDELTGTVIRRGNRVTGYGYHYARGESLIPAGEQATLINAVFSLI